MTPEELQAERDACLYYTESREGAYALEFKDAASIPTFFEHCQKSKAVFLNSRHWGVIIGDNDFAPLFVPSLRYETIQRGYVGSIVGCEVFTNAFVPPQAKEGHTSEDVVFVPR